MKVFLRYSELSIQFRILILFVVLHKKLVTSEIKKFTILEQNKCA